MRTALGVIGAIGAVAALAASLLVEGCGQPIEAGTVDSDSGPTDDVGVGDSSVDDAGACTICGGQCVDTATSREHCGGCDRGCPSQCFEGVCEGNKVKQLAGGRAFACALLSSGSVYCWGAHEFGQLGSSKGVDATTNRRLKPEKVLGLGKVVQIAAGAWSACAVGEDGNVRCWGRSELGAIGRDPIADADCAEGRKCVREPVLVPGLSGVTEVVLSEFSGCALTKSGGVSCWGQNRNGNVGTGTFSATPTFAPVAAAISNVTDLASSSHYEPHVCAVHDGGVSCWGRNNFTNTGQTPGAPCIDHPCTPTPTSVAGLPQAMRVSNFDNATCALAATGELYCWGHCGTGVVANAAACSASITITTPSKIDGLPAGKLVEITGSYAHACGIEGNGARNVWCWGVNTSGQVGDGTSTGSGCANTCRAAPTRVAMPDGSSFKGEPFPATGAFTLAIDLSGRAWAWGENGAGQLGHEPSTSGDRTCLPLGSGVSTPCHPAPGLVEGLP